MKRIATTIEFVLLPIAIAFVTAQASVASPSPEVRKWDIFAGDWALGNRSTKSTSGL